MDDFVTTLCHDIGYRPVFNHSDTSRNYFHVVILDELRYVAGFEVSQSLLFHEFSDQEYDDLDTLFRNNIWPQNQTLTTSEDILAFIRLNYPDRSPISKADRLLHYIQRQSRYDGDYVSVQDFYLQGNHQWKSLFLNDQAEFTFYLSYLIRNDFLESKEFGKEGISYVRLTVKGIEKVIEIQQTLNSKSCFVAMSFDETLRSVYEKGIHPAIQESGFESIRIDDDKAIPSDFTINDAILASIKKSKFIIADFTGHKSGVYFEAAYALGLGKKVIYTCKDTDIDKAHFDTRNYPHIVWKDAEDLKRKLIDKIEVFIKA